MGGKQSKSDKNNADQILQHNHLRLRNAGKVVAKDEDQIEAFFPVGTQNQYEAWKKSLERDPCLNCPHAFLPVQTSINKQGFCGKSYLAKGRYPAYWYLLSDQIKNRRKFEKKIGEEEIWYLLHSLSEVSADYHLCNTKVGDIRPSNILLNESGDIKVVTQHSWPQEQTNYEKTLLLNEKTYLSPEQNQEVRIGRTSPNNDIEQSQAFSTGLTLLDAALEEDSYDLYQKKGDFDQYKLRQKKQRLKNDPNYSDLLKSTILNLTEMAPEKRLRSNQVINWLEPNKIQIDNCQPFQAEQLPQQIQTTIVQNGLSRPMAKKSSSSIPLPLQAKSSSSYFPPSGQKIELLNSPVQNQTYSANQSQPQTLQSGLLPEKLESAPMISVCEQRIDLPPPQRATTTTYLPPGPITHNSYVPPSSTTYTTSNINSPTQRQTIPSRNINFPPQIVRETRPPIVRETRAPTIHTPIVTETQPSYVSSKYTPIQPILHDNSRPNIHDRMNMRDFYKSPEIVSTNFDRRYDSRHSEQKRKPQVKYAINNPQNEQISSNYKPIVPEKRQYSHPYSNEINTNYKPVLPEKRDSYTTDINIDKYKPIVSEKRDSYTVDSNFDKYKPIVSEKRDSYTIDSNVDKYKPIVSEKRDSYTYNSTSEKKETFTTYSNGDSYKPIISSQNKETYTPDDSYKYTPYVPESRDTINSTYNKYAPKDIIHEQRQTFSSGGQSFKYTPTLPERQSFNTDFQYKPVVSDERESYNTNSDSDFKYRPVVPEQRETFNTYSDNYSPLVIPERNTYSEETKPSPIIRNTNTVIGSDNYKPIDFKKRQVIGSNIRQSQQGKKNSQVEKGRELIGSAYDRPEIKKIITSGGDEPGNKKKKTVIESEGGIFEVESEISHASQENYRMDFIPSQNNLSIKQSLSKGKISYANDDDDGEERLVQGGNYNIPYSNNNVPSSSYNNYQSSGISDSKNSDDYRPSMNNGSSSPGTKIISSKKKTGGHSKNVDVNKIMENMNKQTVEIIEHPKN